MTTVKLWASNPTPASTDSGDGSSYAAMGTHFKVSSNVRCTGMRFYGVTANSGTHYGLLFRASDKALLAIGTFTDTTNGWRELTFTGAAALVANTDYLIAYTVPNGHYSVDASYFASAAYTADAPFTAYKSGDISPGNGVYAVTSIIRYPNTVGGDSNYWVGPIIDDGFTTDTVGDATRLFAHGETVVSADSGDGSAYNLGMNFVVEADGFINGIYFYKHANNTGTHTVNLWSNAGTKLAEKVVSGETSSGWQYQAFDTPVAVTAGSTYMASYVCPNGHYSNDTSYFGGSYRNSPLKGTGSAFISGATIAKPNTTGTTNYWIDADFTPASVSGVPFFMLPDMLSGGFQSLGGFQ